MKENRVENFDNKLEGKLKKKLNLKKETVRELKSSELKMVAGGASGSSGTITGSWNC